jgi:hypothetical protein
MKDYGIDVFAQCIDGKVVFVRKPLVFKDDNKPFFDRDKLRYRPESINDEHIEQDKMNCAVLKDAPLFCFPQF